MLFDNFPYTQLVDSGRLVFKSTEKNKMEDDILSRLQSLEEENRRLRRAAGIKPLETTTFVSMWKNLPVITFETTTGRPFTFGVKKAMTILEKIEDIKKFVNEYKNYKSPDDGQGHPPHPL